MFKKQNQKPFMIEQVLWMWERAVYGTMHPRVVHKKNSHARCGACTCHPSYLGREERRIVI
jgi:hypothetical protein